MVRGKRAAAQHEAEMLAKLSHGGFAGASDHSKTVRQYLEEILEAKKLLSPNTRRSLRQQHPPAHLSRAGRSDGQQARPSARVDGILRVGREAVRAGGPTSLRVAGARDAQRRRPGPHPGPQPPSPASRFRSAAASGTSRTPPSSTTCCASATPSPRNGAARRGKRRVPDGAGPARLADRHRPVRVGELLAIAPDTDIDPQRRTLTTSRQLIYLSGEGFVFAPPNTDGCGRRVIPLPRFVPAAVSTTQLRNGLAEITLPWQEAGAPVTQK
ncbi:MAG: hypothetical protein NVS3B26_10940 [Mycobacteriales bacterium]